MKGVEASTGGLLELPISPMVGLYLHFLPPWLLFLCLSCTAPSSFFSLHLGAALSHIHTCEEHGRISKETLFIVLFAELTTQLWTFPSELALPNLLSQMGERGGL